MENNKDPYEIKSKCSISYPLNVYAEEMQDQPSKKDEVKVLEEEEEEGMKNRKEGNN